MSGAVAIESKPNYSEKKSIIISFKKKQNDISLNHEFKKIDKELTKLEEKYVSAVKWESEEERNKKEKLILDHYNLRTNKNIKNIESNLELFNYQGRVYYYGLSDFIEFCNSWGNCITKIEKLYLDKMYLYAIKSGRINKLKEIEDIFYENNFGKILIQKSLNKSQVAANFKRIYIHDIVESIKNKDYNGAIDKVLYYSNNIIENYLRIEENKTIVLK